ncbi:MAG TPA: signal peptide peptidase SppA [Candidatus Cloacimonas acidaminovorans]|nr:signal peptide peptidase SppA [Candidatus Cloacimonas acidaminovorans]
MKSNKTVLWGCLIFVIALLAAFILGFIFTFGSHGAKSAKIPSNAWLYVNPSALLPDYNELEELRFVNVSSPSVQEICAKIKLAAKDERIKGILLQPQMIMTNYPALEEMSLAIGTFQKSGKPVLAFGDNFTQGDYLLASCADKIYMEPSASAGLALQGVSANMLFYKEMLDKLGIKMHILQSGEYKGAGEPFSQTELSKGTKENIDAALYDIYNHLLSLVAQNRKLETTYVKDIFEKRDDFFLSAEKAKELKLIDFAMSRDEMLKSLGLEEDNFVKIANYSPTAKKKKGDKIAVVYLNGNIAPVSRSNFGSQGIISEAKVKKIIKQIHKHKDIKAVVLRINSPGGSALESELIYQQLLKLKREYPLVVSMGGTAASGGYYISCAGDYLIADPGTLTGSIGVIGLIPEMAGLGKKIGVRSQTLKYGKFAGALSPLEHYDPALIESLKRSSTATYNEFKQRVMTARKISPENIEAVAEGRIFSAEDALANKLIDEIGTLDKAIAKAAGLAKVTPYSSVNFPKKESYWEALRESDLLNLKERLQNNNDPATQLEKYLKQISATGEWLYLMPYTLE